MRCLPVHVIKCESACYRRSYYYAQLHGQKWSRFWMFYASDSSPSHLRMNTKTIQKNALSLFPLCLSVKAHTFDAKATVFVPLKLIYLLCFSPHFFLFLSHLLSFSFILLHFFAGSVYDLKVECDGMNGKGKDENAPHISNYIVYYLCILLFCFI